MKITEFEKGICYKHTGKMEGMISYSTSCLDNKFCKAYSADPNKVCSHCYAQRMEKMYKGLEKKTKVNGDYIKHHMLEDDEIPFINAAFFRFEAFGDLETIIQARNYFEVARKNPHCKFALWTKNPNIIHYGMKILGFSKPKNLSILVSSPYLNTVVDTSKYDFVDHVFTVYDSKFIEDNGIKINCGGNHCLTCQRCYKKNTSFYVNEKLK